MKRIDISLYLECPLDGDVEPDLLRLQKCIDNIKNANDVFIVEFKKMDLSPQIRMNVTIRDEGI